MTRRIEQLAGGFRLAESPRWHDGHFYFVDMYSNSVHRLRDGGVLETVCELAYPSGIGWLPDGDMLIVASHDCALYRRRGTVLRKFADLGGRGLALANDMVNDAKGGSYVGGIGPGYEAGTLAPSPLLYVSAEGSVSVAARDLHCPNGMAITPDSRVLIVAETFAFRLTAFDIGEDGALSGRRIWAEFGKPPALTHDSVINRREMLPDGIALDSEGAVWVANCRPAGGVVRVAEGGNVLDKINVGGNDTVLAPALGGPDRSDLYLIAGPGFDFIDDVLREGERPYRVLRTKVGVPGGAQP